MKLPRENIKMLGKLAVVAAGMFSFGYALVPIYKTICEVTGNQTSWRWRTQYPGRHTARRVIRRST